MASFMVDERKIVQEANLRYTDSFVGEEDAFVEGAKFAEEEFIKSLWHKHSETPKYQTQIIYTVKEFYNHISSITIASKETWQSLKKKYKEFKWCYSKDLLPKYYFKAYV